MVLLSFPSNMIPRSIERLSHCICITSTSQANTTSNNPHYYSRKSNHEKANMSCSYHSQFPRQPLTRSGFSHRRKDLLPTPLGAKSSEPGEDDSRALETILKLYSAIRSKNIREVSDVIGDECQCWCNFFSSSQPLQGKKQVLDFFSYLMTSLGNNIDFAVTPTMQDGMRVGIKWRLEWKNTHVPLGKGFSIHICHVYRGKVFIRNVDMFLEPLLHIEHFRLVTLGFATTLIDKMSTNLIFKDKPKSVLNVLLRLFITAVLVHLLKHVLLH